MCHLLRSVVSGVSALRRKSKLLQSKKALQYVSNRKIYWTHTSCFLDFVGSGPGVNHFNMCRLNLPDKCTHTVKILRPPSVRLRQIQLQLYSNYYQVLTVLSYYAFNIVFRPPHFLDQEVTATQPIVLVGATVFKKLKVGSFQIR